MHPPSPSHDRDGADPGPAAPRPSKRRRAPSARGGRVVLDVGGTEFVAAASTLASDSSYFSSLLSARWNDGDDNDGEEEGPIFLDQDPAPFAVLLGYLRRGSLRVEDVDERVLHLAEFLGMERFLAAAKARWHSNLGRGPALDDVDEAAEAFDRRYGGIRGAVARGLFPSFARRDDLRAEQESAIATVFSPDGDFAANANLTVEEVDEGAGGELREADGLVGALNGLHALGYDRHEAAMDRSNRYERVLTFSRRKHPPPTRGGGCDVVGAEIFAPSAEEVERSREGEATRKQFALLLEETDAWREAVVAPAELAEAEGTTTTSSSGSGSSSGSRGRDEDPFAVVVLDGHGPWLAKHGFATREEGYERLFEGYLKSLLAHRFPGSRREAFRRARIFSRRVDLFEVRMGTPSEKKVEE
ncbi:hypothetical protein ACHAWF_001676 [Thalassiosira exigua]